MATYAPPVYSVAEERFHAPLDYAEASSRRKTVVIALLGLIIAGQIAVITKLALIPKDAYFAVQMPNGETYIISSPRKKIDVRAGTLGYEVVKQTLTSFSEAYFEKSSVTANRDYDHARWFLPNTLLPGYDAAASGPNGWVSKLLTHAIPESHAHIDNVEMRDSDIQQEPYQARVYFTRTDLQSGKKTKVVAAVTFVIRPYIWATDKISRFPYYNALGLMVVKPIEETEFTQ